MWKEPVRSGAVLSGVAMLYFVFERSGYTLLTILANLLLVLVVGTFVWSTASSLSNGSLPAVPVPDPANPEALEKAFDSFSERCKVLVNKTLGMAHRLAKGTDPALSIKAALILYAVAKVSESQAAFVHSFVLSFCARHHRAEQTTDRE